MPGLTKRKIERFALARGHGEFADCLLIDFLNAARTAQQVATVNNDIVPAQVPDMDGREVLIKSFQLPLEAGKEIVAKRESLGGSFSKLSQLSSLATLGNTELGILINAFSVANVELNGVWFDHNSNGFSNDALPMRKNYDDPISLPEWEDTAGHKKHEESPACYSIADTKNNQITIKARFSGPASQSVYIKGRNIGDNKFGFPDATLISFDTNGDSGWVEFPLAGVNFHNKGIQVYNISWRWHFALTEKGAFCPFGKSSHHSIYTVLEAPKAPWVLLAGSNQAPWQSALELACNWAKGAKNVDDAAAEITISHFGSGFQYVGISNYSTPFDFFLTDYLTKIHDMRNNPLPDHVNCTDCAASVSTLANLVGHDLWQSKMGLESRAFQYKKITPIGAHRAVTGFFQFHEVAWKGSCDFSERLFDGCLKVNGSLQRILPLDIKFGDCRSGGYRQLMTSPALVGCPLCPEKPETKIRRFLI